MEKIKHYFQFSYPFERYIENDIHLSLPFQNNNHHILGDGLNYLTEEEAFNNVNYKLFEPYHTCYKHTRLEKIRKTFPHSAQKIRPNTIILTFENWGSDFSECYTVNNNKIETGFVVINRLLKDGFVYSALIFYKKQNGERGEQFHHIEKAVPYQITDGTLDELVEHELYRIIFGRYHHSYQAGEATKFIKIKDRIEKLNNFLDYHFELCKLPKNAFLEYINIRKDCFLKKNRDFEIELIKALNDWIERKQNNLKLVHELDKKLFSENPSSGEEKEKRNNSASNKEKTGKPEVESHISAPENKEKSTIEKFESIPKHVKDLFSIYQSEFERKGNDGQKALDSIAIKTFENKERTKYKGATLKNVKDRIRSDFQKYNLIPKKIAIE